MQLPQRSFDRPLRIAILGCGMMGQGKLMPLTEIWIDTFVLSFCHTNL